MRMQPTSPFVLFIRWIEGGESQVKWKEGRRVKEAGQKKRIYV